MAPKTCPKCESDQISISVVNGEEDKYACRACSNEWYPERLDRITQPLSKAKKNLAKALNPKSKAKR